MMLSSLNKIKENYKEIIFIILSVFILQLSFNYNSFDATSNSVYKEYENDSSEALVIGKVLNSRYDNIFNEFVLGWYGEPENQYKFYLNNLNPNNNGLMNVYNSSFGLQGYIYSIIEKTLDHLNLKSADKLNIIVYITSLFMAFIIIVFANSIRKEFGLFTSLVLIISIVFSQWLVLFAKDIYWIFGLVLLPFIYSWVSLQKNQEALNISGRIYFFISLFIFIKSLCGFEYLSTIFISIIIPYIYFSIKNNWGVFIFLKRVVLLYLYAFLGFGGSIVFYLLQKALIIGSFKEAYLNLIYTIKKRTAINSEGLDQVFRDSIESSTFDVLMIYWNGKAFDLHSIFNKFTFITFGEIVIFFILFTFIFFILLKFKFFNKLKAKKLLALLIATWISILSPFSWYILAKPHSYIHDFFNQVLWHVPYIPLVFVFVAYLISSIKYNKINLKTYFIIFIIIISFLYIYSKNNDNKITLLLKDNIEIFHSENNLKIHINKENNQLIYVYKNCKKENLHESFFLHIYPLNVNLLSDSRKEWNFDNLDFDWKSFELNIPLFSKYKSFCIAIKDLPVYSIKNINTGQVSLWETKKIDLDLNYNRDKELIAYNLTDNNWRNGISLIMPALFIKNTFINKQSFSIGDKLQFSKSGIRTITEITYNNKYINITVDGEKLNPLKDGYPNKILIEREK